MTFDLLYAKDGRNYWIKKVELGSGREEPFTKEDAEALLEQEATRLKYEKMLEESKRWREKMR